MSCPRSCHVPGHVMSPVMSCHVPGHVMSPVMSCPRSCQVPGHVMSPVMSCPRSCHVPGHVMSPVMSCHVPIHVMSCPRSCHVMSPVMSCHVMSPVMSCHVPRTTKCHMHWILIFHSGEDSGPNTILTYIYLSREILKKIGTFRAVLLGHCKFLLNTNKPRYLKFNQPEAVAETLSTE